MPKSKVILRLFVNNTIIGIDTMIKNRHTGWFKHKMIEEHEGKFVACDNSTGDAWTEEFDTLQEAYDWVLGRKEVL